MLAPPWQLSPRGNEDNGNDVTKPGTRSEGNSTSEADSKGKARASLPCQMVIQVQHRCQAAGESMWQARGDRRCQAQSSPEDEIIVDDLPWEHIAGYASAQPGQYQTGQCRARSRADCRADCRADRRARLAINVSQQSADSASSGNDEP